MQISATDGRTAPPDPVPPASDYVSDAQAAEQIADCADLEIVPMSLRNPLLCGVFRRLRSAQSKSLARRSGQVIMKSPRRAGPRPIGGRRRAGGRDAQTRVDIRAARRSGPSQSQVADVSRRSHSAPAARPRPRTRIVPTYLARIPYQAGDPGPRSAQPRGRHNRRSRADPTAASGRGSSLVVSSICWGDDAPRTPGSGLSPGGRHDHHHPVDRHRRVGRTTVH